MSALEQEIVPLTEAEIAGWKACRFVTTTIDQESAWGFTNDPSVYEAIRRYSTFPSCPRQIVTDPRGLQEYEVRTSHPEAVALVLSLMRERGLKTLSLS